VVLSLAAGIALDRWAGWRHAVPIALVAGWILALLLPRRAPGGT
jgi:hypothetical protein